MKKRLKTWIWLLALVVGLPVLLVLASWVRHEIDRRHDERVLEVTRFHAQETLARYGTDETGDEQSLADANSIRETMAKALSILEDGMPEQPVLLSAYFSLRDDGLMVLGLDLLDPEFETRGVFVEGKDGQVWDFPDLVEWDYLRGDLRLWWLFYTVGPWPADGEPTWTRRPSICLSREDIGDNPKVGLIYRKDQRGQAIPCRLRYLSSAH